MNKENITKEGIEVRVGQIWRDLDKRMGDRKRQVVSLCGGRATMGRVGFSTEQKDTMRTRVSISRMHKSATGWELVVDVVDSNGEGNPVEPETQP